VVIASNTNFVTMIMAPCDTGWHVKWKKLRGLCPD
jgi:hypothetical protein